MRTDGLSVRWVVPVLLAGTVWCGGRLSADEFRPQTVIPRAFPAITRVPVMNAAEADRQLRPGELILGVRIGKHARAYPINMLTGPKREIINEKLAGRAIAATW